ncbi:hypothetical protein Cylst_4547 [Cylindrospermum stagnale PCC 7417]|uniref:Uncharacterized protein n=1 Tax=Cylindrospermum stagnale PCC 7417 TaxID=56107 RepID=K9X1X9_9NOST|nr:hypothetical protein [Cylindrospermum stagnale]AFZ26625.1 hypothetical protein Cylst_4547 [Cylindrospermum stagnale PCC 7417]
MLSQEQNLLSDWKFLEIWVDPTGFPPYILMLINNSNGWWYILDPIEGYKVLFSSQSYEDVKFWLLEDEYECVRGRFAREE